MLKNHLSTKIRYTARGMGFWVFINALLICNLYGSEQALPSRKINLVHWGIEDPSEIGYISVGILHKQTGDELIVYDIRKDKPRVSEPVALKNQIPSFIGDVYLLDDFQGENTNRLRGYFGNFYGSPSESHITIEKPPDDLSALYFSYNQKRPGFAGFWIHLFDFKKPLSQRVFLDSTPFSFFTFNIKGEAGGEQLALQVADYFWEKREDSVKVGDIESFLPSGRIKKFWQRGWVPLESIPNRIDRKYLASLVFQAQSGRGKIWISDIALTRQKNVPIVRPHRKKFYRSVEQKGMWVWNTRALLADREKQDQIVQFCLENAITDIFLQLPMAGGAKINGIISWDEEKVRFLISLFHSKKIRVHALDGDPRFALREWHHYVIETVRSLVRFNRSVSSKERFDGLRYDIEPYLLPEFPGIYKNEIMNQYLDLLRRIMEETRHTGIEVGVDIPFWFDENNLFYEPVAELEGRPLAEWIIDIVDNIGIMDYRTQAFGADGILVHAKGELQYASKKGKKVFIGLETLDLPDETIIEFEKGNDPPGIQIRKSEGTSITLRYIPAGISFGKDSTLYLSQKKKTFVSSKKLSFAKKSAEDLERVMESAKAELVQFPSFVGFAIHYFESYQRLRAKRKRIVN